MSVQGSSDLYNLKIILGIRLLTFIIKLVIFFNTGAMAFLADALHSLSDIFLTIFLLIGVVISRKDADEIHMFGHARAQNVAALIAAILFISFTSYKMIEEAVPRLFLSKEVISYQNLSMAIIAGVIVMIITAIPILLILKQEKRRASIKAQLMDLLNDEFSTLAAIGGVIGIMRGVPILDPIATLLVAVLIAYNGVRLARENISYLLGRTPGKKFIKNVREIILSVKGVQGVHSLKAEYAGPDTVNVGMHIVVKKGLSIEEANLIRKKVRNKVHDFLDMKNHYCYIQVDVKKDTKQIKSDN